MIAYYVYGTLRFREVLEKRLEGKANPSQLKILYQKATLNNFQRLIAATYDGANAAFPVKGAKINGEHVETVVAEAGTFQVPEGRLLLVDGPVLELIKVMPSLDRYEQSYVKVEVPVERKEIKRAYVYAAYPWRVTPEKLKKLPSATQKLLNSLAEYYTLSRIQTEEIQRTMREAYEKEIKKNKSQVILYG